MSINVTLGWGFAFPTNDRKHTSDGRFVGQTSEKRQRMAPHAICYLNDAAFKMGNAANYDIHSCLYPCAT